MKDTETSAGRRVAGNVHNKDGGDHDDDYVLQINKLDATHESSIWGIGEGIIGSASEEEGRRRLDWQERKCYLLPRKEGIACGWIHKHKTNVNNSNGTTGSTTTKRG